MKHFNYLTITIAALTATLPLTAEVPLILSHQGRITVQGVNPTGPAEFKFALTNGGVDLSLPATATAVVALTKITEINVVEQGAGYLFPPQVTILDSKGTGFGAIATAVLNGSKVESITVDQGGADYTGTITVVIDPPPPSIHFQTYWKNDGATGSTEPATAVTLNLTQGLYGVELGNPDLMAAIPASAFKQPEVYLRTWVRPAGEANFVELLPIQRITAVAYAVLAASVEDGAIDTAQLADESVTSEKIAPGTITGDRIANATILGSQIAPSSITGDQIAGESIRGDHIDSRTIDSIHLADGSITLAKLAPDVVLGGGPGSAPVFPSGTALQVPPGTDSSALREAGFEYRGRNRSNDQWHHPSQGTQPLPFASHPAVWTGREALYWGGLTGGPLQAYDPERNHWSRPNLQGTAPAPRYGHSATWCGQQVIFWGGWVEAGEATVTRSGAAYNPITQTWTAIPEGIDVPDGRALHTAIWTGERLLIWGGKDFKGDPMNTGAQYDPTTGEWTKITTNGAPTHRFSHTAVWTGERMIIWGGESILNTKLRTGASYDPVTNTWTPLTEVGAPAARTGHAAVWAGTGMLIWGGEGDVPYKSGFLYNPAADFWAPIDAVEAPSARTGFASAWTGSELLISGGRTAGGDLLADGAAYSLATNSWRTLATLYQPRPRSEAGAVWTGREFLIFGGSVETSPDTEIADSRGAAYSPEDDQWHPVGFQRPSQIAALTAAGDAVFAWNSIGGGWLYFPEQNRWILASLEGAPPAGIDYDIFSNSETVLFWGGPGQSFVYTIATDTWTPMPEMFIPPERGRAAWTGEHLLVFYREMVDGFPVSRITRYTPGGNKWLRYYPQGRIPPYHVVFPINAIWTNGHFVLLQEGGTDYGNWQFVFNLADVTWTRHEFKVQSGNFTFVGDENFPIYQGLDHSLGWAALGEHIVNFNNAGFYFQNDGINGNFTVFEAGRHLRLVPGAGDTVSLTQRHANATDVIVNARTQNFFPGRPRELAGVVHNDPITGTSAVAAGDEIIIFGGNAPTGGYRYHPESETLAFLHVHYPVPVLERPILLWHQDRLFITKPGASFYIYEPGREFDLFVKP